MTADDMRPGKVVLKTIVRMHADDIAKRLRSLPPPLRDEMVFLIHDQVLSCGTIAQLRAQAVELELPWLVEGLDAPRMGPGARVVLVEGDIGWVGDVEWVPDAQDAPADATGN